MIKGSSEKLLEIVTDIIEISQIQQNQASLHTNICNPQELLNIIITSFMEKSSQKSLKLNLDLDDKLKNIQIETDCYKLRRSIDHILDNALKFTHKGSISIKTQSMPNDILISISDTGIGIPDAIMNKIFAPFRQVETEDSKRFSGNGIGLSLARSYLEMLSGKIWIESVVNVGTTVSISLPKGSHGKQNLYDIKETKQKNSLKGLQILVAEDEEINFLYLKEILSNAGAEVFHAKNGQIAVDMCKENKDWALILMDIKMPIMDGIKATKLIRESNTLVPIIAQSAYDPINIYDTNNQEMFTAFISKPIRQSELFDLIYCHI